MAFPASPSNNQVHKEGNRAFVYDSTLGTWDRIAETNLQQGQIPQGSNDYFEGKLTDVTDFPSGHIIQVVTAVNENRVDLASTSTAYVASGQKIRITPKRLRSKILLVFMVPMGVVATATSGANMSANIYRSGASVINSFVWGKEDSSTTSSKILLQTFEAAPRTWNCQEKSPRFLQFLDEPLHTNTTDFLEYSVEGKLGTGYNFQISGDQCTTMTAMEVMNND